MPQGRHVYVAWRAVLLFRAGHKASEIYVLVSPCDAVRSLRWIGSARWVKGHKYIDVVGFCNGDHEEFGNG